MMIVNVKLYDCEMAFDLKDDDIKYSLSKHHEDVYSFMCDDIDDVAYIIDYVQYRFDGLNYIIEILK